MATYLELYSLMNDNDLTLRSTAAVVIAANGLLEGTPTAADTQWAAAVLANPRSEGKKAFMAVLAKNKDASVAGIQGANDAALQTNIDAVVPSLVDALAGA